MKIGNLLSLLPVMLLVLVSLLCGACQSSPRVEETPAEPETTESAMGILTAPAAFEFTDISNSIDTNGYITDKAVVESSDGKITVVAEEGASIKHENDDPVTEIAISETFTPAAITTLSVIISKAYKIEPEQAVIDGPVSVCMVYDPAEIIAGTGVDDLLIARWYEPGHEWIIVDEPVIDTVVNTVCVPLEKFGIYVIMIPSRPATFAVSNLVIEPEEAMIGENIDISVLVTNTGDLSAQYRLDLRIDNAVVTSKWITLDGGAGITVMFSVSAVRAGTYAVSLWDKTGEFTVTQQIAPSTPDPAEFIIGDLTIAPKSIDVGDQTRLSVTVTNRGDLVGSYDVAMAIDDVTKATREVTLEGNQSVTISFLVTGDKTGTYNVDVNGVTGVFVVRELQGIHIPFHWWIIGGGIIVAILAVTVIWLFIRSRSY